jgi:hypothetical protein
VPPPPPLPAQAACTSHQRRKSRALRTTPAGDASDAGAAASRALASELLQLEGALLAALVGSYALGEMQLQLAGSCSADDEACASGYASQLEVVQEEEEGCSDEGEGEGQLAGSYGAAAGSARYAVAALQLEAAAATGRGRTGSLTGTEHADSRSGASSRRSSSSSSGGGGTGTGAGASAASARTGSSRQAADSAGPRSRPPGRRGPAGAPGAQQQAQAQAAQGPSGSTRAALAADAGRRWGGAAAGQLQHHQEAAGQLLQHHMAEQQQAQEAAPPPPLSAECSASTDILLGEGLEAGYGQDDCQAEAAGEQLAGRSVPCQLPGRRWHCSASMCTIPANKHPPPARRCAAPQALPRPRTQMMRCQSCWGCWGLTTVAHWRPWRRGGGDPRVCCSPRGTCTKMAAHCKD